MTTLNISFAEELMAFIESRISMGDYRSVSDYLGDLVMQDRQKMEQTDQLLAEGFESGDPRPLSMASIRAKAVSILEERPD
jgi:antitoxin ParD1/3/4